MLLIRCFARTRQAILYKKNLSWNAFTTAYIKLNDVTYCYLFGFNLLMFFNC